METQKLALSKEKLKILTNTFKKTQISFLSRLFSIAPSQWPRVIECWFITFFFKMGVALGWVVITAAFVGRFGITSLPFLFIFDALLIILSTIFFEHLIMRMKREVLMISMLFCGALCLLFAATLYEQSIYGFFALVIIAEAVFLAQFNVFLPILVGDRFTPLESQSTFPFIESSETIGGIVGGVIVALLGGHLPVPVFMLIWIVLIVCVIGVFVVTSMVREGLPHLPIRATSHNNQDRTRVRDIIKNIGKVSFLKSLIFIVCIQWIFMNVLDYQYTRSVENAISRTQPVIATQVDPTRSLSLAAEAELSAKLGTLKSGFHTAALIVQAFIAPRLIGPLGVVGSMLLHPIIMLLSLVGLFFKYGLLTSVIARMNFDMSNVIHKNAYFTSHYALPKSIRDQAAEFLEGIVRPLGTVIGMGLILLVEYIFVGKDMSMWIHGGLVIIMVIILILTLKLQGKYTDITREQLFSELPYPEKLNAIEILSQRGHAEAPRILAEKLSGATNNRSEVAAVRIKLLTALGEFADYETLPDILHALADADPDVRLEAAHTLLSFDHIGQQFYAQAFSRFRLIETLKDTFKKETSATVRAAIIRVFSIVQQPDIVPFLLDMLTHDSPYMKADCIATLGLFHDPNVAFYILPALHDQDPKVRANVIIALWQFPKYRSIIEEELQKMLSSSDHAIKRAGIFVLGEVDAPHYNHILVELVQGTDVDYEHNAAFALTKHGDARGIVALVERYLLLPHEEFETLRRFMHRLTGDVKKNTQQTIVHIIAEHVKLLMKQYVGKRLHDVDGALLEKLRRLYKLIDQHEELHEIETVISELETGISPALPA